MTGYLMSLNGGPLSWKSSRQGDVTLSRQAAVKLDLWLLVKLDKNVVYIRALLRGFRILKWEPQRFGEITLPES